MDGRNGGNKAGLSLLSECSFSEVLSKKSYTKTFLINIFHHPKSFKNFKLDNNTCTYDVFMGYIVLLNA